MSFKFVNKILIKSKVTFKIYAFSVFFLSYSRI